MHKKLISMVESKINNLGILLFLQDEAGLKGEVGQGAATLSLRSQMKLTPEVLSKVASEGKLGRRQPYSDENIE